MSRNQPLAKIRVLLADDHEDMRGFVSNLLASGPCEVVATVGVGQAALEAAVQMLPEVAVLDISMPVLNGIQVARRLRQANPTIKIVFLTVDRDAETCRAALATGAQGYVLKLRLGTDLIPAINSAKDGLHIVSPGCE
jgi:DNA-binding NarL/FixJ family response regulator